MRSLSLALVLLLSGCVGLSPALTGKTKYTMNFEDVLGETKDADGSVTSPGQTTKFSVDIAAAAGVEDLKELASMKYHVTPEGVVEIDVASSSQMDTTGQAAALVQAHKATLEAVKEITPVITEAVTKSVLSSLGISGHGRSFGRSYNYRGAARPVTSLPSGPRLCPARCSLWVSRTGRGSCFTPCLEVRAQTSGSYPRSLCSTQQPKGT